MRERVLRAADRIALLSKARPDAARVLMVRLDNIGDFVVWLDAAKAMAQHYQAQGKHVTLLANAVWAGWAREIGIFDEVVALEERRFRRSLRYRLRMARQIRAGAFGTAVQTSYTRILSGGDAVVRISGAVERIGPEGSFDLGAEGARRIADPWFSRLLPADPALGSEMERNGAFVRALTGTAYRARVADLREHAPMVLPEALSDEIAGKPYFVLFPGATFAGRLWPVEHYLEIARRLHEATGWVCVVSGGPSEETQAAWICAHALSPCLNWVGRTSLSGLLAVLAQAELLVGNETSAVHVAAAVGTRAVCITGGGHFGRFMPYPAAVEDGRPLPMAAVHRMECFHCDWRCAFHPPKGAPVPCIDQVSVARVWAMVEQLLGGHPGGNLRHPRVAEPLRVLQGCC